MSPSTSTTISTRFMILSDTHNFDIDNPTVSHHPLQNSLPTVDVLLHCGDLTHAGGIPSFKKAIKLLSSIPAKLKLVIAGNHDLELDKPYWESHLLEDDEVEDHDAAMEVMKGRLAKEADVVYLEEGVHSFDLENGAKLRIYASPYTPDFCEWAFAYKHHQDRFNKAEDVFPGYVPIAQNPIPDCGEVDIVMTHGPPKGILDECAQGNVGCPSLLRAVTRCEPLLHCFGHIHEGNGAIKMHWDSGTRVDVANPFPEAVKQNIVPGPSTLMVNAAINDGGNTPTNAPWIVDLQLPKAEGEEECEVEVAAHREMERSKALKNAGDAIRRVLDENVHW